MKRLVLLFLAIVTVSKPLSFGANPEDEAKKSTETWLSLVDAGKFDDSWKTAGTYLQHACAEDVWKHKLDAMRKPLGDVQSRRLQSAKFEQADQFLTAEHVRLQFATSFAKKKDAVETLTAARQKDGTWKVSGYYIK